VENSGINSAVKGEIRIRWPRFHHLVIGTLLKSGPGSKNNQEIAPESIVKGYADLLKLWQL
jgi:hypothetical protein